MGKHGMENETVNGVTWNACQTWNKGRYAKFPNYEEYKMKYLTRMFLLRVFFM